MTNAGLNRVYNVAFFFFFLLSLGSPITRVLIFAALTVSVISDETEKTIGFHWLARKERGKNRINIKYPRGAHYKNKCFYYYYFSFLMTVSTTPYVNSRISAYNFRT